MLVRRPGGDWHEPEVSAYPSEAELQGMIAESPSLLPGVEGPVAVARELGCAYGRIDVVGVDLGGQIIVCECKAARNPELRRKVVGQIFAYAAALWGLSWEEFARRFEEAAGAPLVDQVRALADEAGEDDWDEEHFREMTARCLETGEFRVVLAVEAIPDELREIVRFLNVHSASRLEVLALELSYRRDGEVEILVPHAWGEETVKPPPDGGPAPLDREKLLAGIGEETPAADAAAAVLDWADREPRFDIRYTPTSAGIWTRGHTFLRVSVRGKIQVELRTLAHHGESWDDERIEQLVQDLAAIGVQLDSTRNWPKAPLEPLGDEARRQQFFGLMEKVLDTLTVALDAAEQPPAPQPPRGGA